MVKVVCAGITGCKKQIAVESVLSSLPTRSRETASQQNVEDILEEKRGVKWGRFLKSLNFNSQENYAREILDEAIRRLSQYEHQFLNLHLTLYHKNRFFAPFPFDRIKDFKPDIMITLIDDVYASWARVKEKSERGEDPVRTYFSLQELLAWRSVEIMMADFLASTLGIHNFVVAVKHPPGMLYSLIFEPHKLIVYVAHPISRFRRESEVGGVDAASLASDKKELNQFIGELQKEFIVFSPTTIDERILRGLQSPLTSGLRWELPSAQMVPETDIQFPIAMKQEEVSAVSPTIDENIRFRDFRLINDVDCSVFFRPYWDKEIHGGVKSEIDYTDSTMIDSVFYFPERDGTLEESPFAGGPSAVYTKVDQTIADLRKRSPRYKRPWGIR